MDKDTLFLDRDGVVNVQLIGDYVKNINEFVFRDDFLAAIPSLRKHFNRFIIVTNQQGIAKGICTAGQVNEVHRHLTHLLQEKGLTINKIYVCPHLAGSGCPCRKPETGMMRQALTDFPEINPARSVMIGDSLSDMQFGRRSGLETVFIGQVTNENRDEVQQNSDHIVGSICEYLENNF